MRDRTRRRPLLTTSIALGAMVLAACGAEDPAANGPAGPAPAPGIEAPSQDVPDGSATPDESVADSADGPAFRPDWLPEQMPLPAGATYSRSIPTMSGGETAFYFVDRPVADVIAELETLLPAAGWTIVDTQEAIAWIDDLLFTVEGHGERFDVYAEPLSGSETETNVIYGPAD